MHLIVYSGVSVDWDLQIHRVTEASRAPCLTIEMKVVFQSRFFICSSVYLVMCDFPANPRVCVVCWW